MKKNNSVLIFSFGVLLLMLLMLGAIGVSQITVLSDRIYDLTKRQVPLQQNVSSMKNNAQLYSAAVRNYVSWRIGKYLGAAQFVVDDREIRSLSEKIFSVIDSYTQFVGNSGHVHDLQLRTLFGKMNDSEKRIVQLVDLSVRSGQEKQNRSKISALLVSFENQTNQFSQFIEENIEPLILESLEFQLDQTKNERSQRILMLLSSVAIVFILGLLCAIFVMKRLIKEQRYSELLVNHMVCAEERERRNLSFQMHNQMGQDLSALKIYLGILNNKHGDSDELDKGRLIVERLLERMHNIAELLCPPGLEDFGLIPILENMVSHYRSILDATIVTDLSITEDALSADNALTLYRVVQEALTNIVKHAEAKNVHIVLSNDDAKISLSINDDGKGFELIKTDTSVKTLDQQGSHLGLLLLKERLSILNGEMHILTAPGQGTTIDIQMPLI